MAFETDGKLYQFHSVLFGLTNRVACFQRIIDKFIADNSLSHTFPYIDNITICGKIQEEHNDNLNKFTKAAKKFNLIYNLNKCSFSNSILDLLVYTISEGTIEPDTERLRLLKELLHDINSLHLVLEMFSYLSQLIAKYSEKVNPHI